MSADANTAPAAPFLRFEDVVVSFAAGTGLMSQLRGRSTPFNAVDHVDLAISQGEILGVVGDERQRRDDHLQGRAWPASRLRWQRHTGRCATGPE
jgi:ABC-type microcin C transport system duplicated ATPase subunit YejF